MMEGRHGRHQAGKVSAHLDHPAGEGWRRFNAEAAYAESIFRSALGDAQGCIAALRHALKVLPTYAPAILSMGSVEYQRGRRARGRRLFLSLLDLPDVTPDLCAIIDKAGDFLIQRGAYADGLELYRWAAARFPKMALFHEGVGCCAGHEGHHDEAIAASRAALALEPDNQKFVNDLGMVPAPSGYHRRGTGDTRTRGSHGSDR
jgi:tetratricopeptide (TPR) repeat protein